MLSLPHLIIVFVVALVVFGPEKLPELARNVGKFTAEFRRMSNEFKSTFEGHLRDLEREADDRRRPTPAAPATMPAPVAENSIRVDTAENAEPAAESPLPPLRPADGIVPSADPRVRTEEASGSEPSNGSHADATDTSTEEGGAAPETVTDGRHHTC
jgi:TatA/E family protein of Tat protein translocase